MELRHIRYFIKASELLHFTRAAEALYISQPTLSIHIQQLEDELGTELFARVGRRVQLTEAGTLLLSRARQAMHALDMAGEEIDAIKGLLRGTLRVAALPLFSSILLPDWITAFNSIHPEVHIQARSGSSEDIETGIISGAIDIGFGMLPVEHVEINTRELFTNEVVMVASEKHPLTKKGRLEAADLHALPVALSSHKVATARLLRNYFDELGIQPRIVVEYDDGNALVTMAKMGALVTFLPKPGFIEDPNLRLLALPEPGLHFTAIALWTHLSPACKGFLDIVTEQAKNLERNAS